MRTNSTIGKAFKNLLGIKTPWCYSMEAWIIFQVQGSDDRGTRKGVGQYESEIANNLQSTTQAVMTWHPWRSQDKGEEIAIWQDEKRMDPHNSPYQDRVFIKVFTGQIARSRAHAFEKYLDSIIEKLAAKRPEGAFSVSYKIQLSIVGYADVK